LQFPATFTVLVVCACNCKEAITIIRINRIFFFMSMIFSFLSKDKVKGFEIVLVNKIPPNTQSKPSARTRVISGRKIITIPKGRTA